MTCLGINHDQLEECGEKMAQYMICVGAYKVENHKYGVIGYTTKKCKIYIYIMPKCANCERNC